MTEPWLRFPWDLLLASEDDPLARELAPFFLGGWSPEVVMQGQIHPMDPRQTPEQRFGTISQQPPPVDLLQRAMGGGAGLPWVAGLAMGAGVDPETAHKMDALAGIVGQVIEAQAAQGTASRSMAARMPPPARLRGKPTTQEGMAPPFYSQVRTVVDDPKTQGTQTGEAWHRFLTDPKRGVRAEEMEWTGLGALLKGRPGSV